MGDRIKQLREAKDMSQEDLGKLVGVQRAAVQKWENGQTKNLKSNVIKALSDFFGVTPSYLMGMSDLRNGIEHKTKVVPVLGTISAGEPILACEEHGIYVATNDERVDFCLRIKGDSMIDARIYDGDLIYVRRQSMVDNGEIAVVVVDNEATLKRFYKADGLIMLRPENSKYKPQVYTEQDFKDVRILGKAVMFQSKL